MLKLRRRIPSNECVYLQGERIFMALNKKYDECFKRYWLRRIRRKHNRRNVKCSTNGYEVLQVLRKCGESHFT